MSDARDIAAGSLVWVRTADSRDLAKVAITPVISGYDFPVVWCVWEHEFDDLLAGDWEAKARAAGRGERVDDLPGLPWPAEDVRLRVSDERRPSGEDVSPDGETGS
jgi:hypothetical protein